MKSYRLKNILYSSVAFFSLFNGSENIAYAQGQDKSKPVVVAITQIVAHPSLDLIRKGIEDELKDQKINCTFTYENAQGKIDTAALIGQKFVSENPNIIVPISTPSTQGVYAAAKTSNIPVVFAAVNDPVSAKLVPTMDKAGQGITGVSDLPPIKDQIALIAEILPKVQKIGVIYNPGESNSDTVLALFEKALPKGVTLVKAGATNMVDVTSAANSLVGKVDAIYVPNDNTVIAALDSLLKVTQTNKIPLFCADPESVKKGCLATVTHSQYGLGRQTGKMIAKVLKGTDIQTLPVERPANVELSINQDAARALEITMPQAVIERANEIIKQ